MIPLTLSRQICGLDYNFPKLAPEEKMSEVSIGVKFMQKVGIQPRGWCWGWGGRGGRVTAGRILG